MIRSNPVPEREEYMANSDSEYPLRQPQRGSHHDPFDDDTEVDDDLRQGRGAHQPRMPRYQTRGPLHQRELPLTPQLPPHSMRDALIIGVIAGVVVALQGIIITLINTPTYNSVKAIAQSQLTLSQAGTLVALFCLTTFISLVIYFIAGFVTGKKAVDRRLGFLAGFLAAVIADIIGYLVHLIPQYPDTTTPGFNGGPGSILGGFVGALILLVVTGLVAGAIGYLGARIATRRHVYYTGYEE